MPQVKRQWRPFAEAREYVRSLGFKKQKEYEEWSKGGSRPPDIPGNPAKAYGPLWDGWADFLGTGTTRPRRVCHDGAFRPYPEARAFVRGLGLGSQKEYAAWSQTADRPADIPANPYIAYRGEWESWGEWLGQRGADGYRPFAEAREYARSKRFKTRAEWAAYANSEDCPPDLPVFPEYAYADGGWVDWPDWLGTPGKLTRPRILAILTALRDIVADLRPAELYAILRYKGVLRASARHTRIDALRALERLCHGGNTDAVLAEAAAALEKHQPAEDDAGAGPTPAAATEEPDEAEAERELSPEEIERVTALPGVRSIDGLRAVDRLVESVGIDDADVLEFLTASRVDALWRQVLNGDPAFTPEALRAAPPGQVFDVIRERFLAEYEAATELPLPPGYAFRKHGHLVQPNLMQRLAAHRLLTARRLINASGVGAGKTLAAAYGSQLAGAKLIIVVAVNATLDHWDRTIRAAFPAAARVVKDRGPYAVDPERPTFIVLNYESFQQDAWSDDMVRDLLARRIDMVVLDEVQSVRLRARNEESNRRRRLRELLAGAAARNPGLYVLGMSATPVLNDLHEARTLLELVTGQDLSDLPTRATVPNAVLYHQLLTRHGLRHRPSYTQSVETEYPHIDGRGVLDRLRRVRPRDVLGMEQAVLEAKLPTIQRLLRPGTLVFTPFVTGVVDRLQEAAADVGLRAGLFTGDVKDGLEQFLAREVDVLIGSDPVGTGIDRLQEVANRLIFASLPWTSAQYDQVVGRLHRQGAAFDTVEVFVPIVELREGDRVWSWDRQRLDRIRFKRTLADAAVDGVIPEGKLPSKEEMQAHSLRTLQAWIEQLQATPPTPASTEVVPVTLSAPAD